MAEFGYYGNGLISLIFTLLFWVVVIYLIVAFIKTIKKSVGFRKDFDKEDDAVEILKVRYAKGEIDKKEFDSMKKDLS